MKILMINSTAISGSTGTITSLLCEEFRNKGHEVLVCYGYNETQSLPPYYKKIRLRIEGRIAHYLGALTGYHNLFCFLSTYRLKKAIMKFKPDIVQLFNLHSDYINDISILKYLKNNDICTIYTMLDEYAYMGKCCFSFECTKFIDNCQNCQHLREYPESYFFDRSNYFFRKKREIYKGFSKLHFVGCDYVVERGEKSALLGSRKIRLIQEPIDFDNCFYPRDTKALREKLRIPLVNKVVLTITNLSDERKGGRFFLDLYKEMKDIPGYTFVYVGFNTNKYGIPPGLITIPYVNDKNELCEFFSLADVFVFTSLADSSPNTVLQALGCGSPCCCFDISGISTIRLNNRSVLSLTEIGNINALKKAVESFQLKDANTIKRCRFSVYKNYSIGSVVNEYAALYEEQINVK